MGLRTRIDPATACHLLLDEDVPRQPHGEIPCQHSVAAYAPAARAVIGQLRVDAKTNEHKASLQLLGLLPLEGRVAVGEATFCQRDVAEKVVTGVGDYVLKVKDNQ